MAEIKTKERNYNVQIVNVKLLSNHRRGDMAYSEIVSGIHQNKVSVPVRGETHMILRTQFKDVVRINDTSWDIIYGKISKYTVIDGKDWLNLNSMEVQNIELPANVFPNLKETEYVFIPNAHRLVVISTRAISVRTIATFLEGAIKEVINIDEDFEVIIEQSEDVFERIINADAIKKLLIDISYSNADTGDEAFQLMEGLIRESESKRLKMEATPNHTGSIKADSRLVSGALKVAQSNGYAQATIVEHGRSQKIDTKEHPLIIPIKCEETALRARIVSIIVGRFRSRNNGHQ